MATCADDKHDFDFGYFSVSADETEVGLYCETCELFLDEEGVKQRLIHFYLTYPEEFMRGLTKQAGTHATDG